MTQARTNARTVEVFTAGCTLCDAVVATVRRLACDACDVRVLDMHEPSVAERAGALGVTGVPAVAVDGQLLDCCAHPGASESALRAAGVGQARI